MQRQTQLVKNSGDVKLVAAGKSVGLFIAGITTAEMMNRLYTTSGQNAILNDEPDSTNEVVSNEVLALEEETSIDLTIQVAHQITDNMSFSEAFSAAREEVGVPGMFKYKGEYYSTYLESEFAELSPDEHESYSQQVIELINNDNSSETTDNEKTEHVKEEAEQYNDTENIQDTANATIADTNEATISEGQPEDAMPVAENAESSAFTVTATAPQYASEQDLDLNEDGHIDTKLINTDEDNQAEMIITTNGKETIAFVDSENDGMIDSQYRLTEEGKLEFIAELDNPFPAPKITVVTQYRDLMGNDGVIDAKLYDKDSDGVADRVDVDVAGDGSFAKAYFDTNGDGHLDTVADVDERGSLSNIITLNEAFAAPELLQDVESTPIEATENENGLLAQVDNTAPPISAGEEEIEGMDNDVAMEEWD